jgi:hypothetical protein
MEPTTVVAKAWEQILIIGQRSPRPRPGHDRAETQTRRGVGRHLSQRDGGRHAPATGHRGRVHRRRVSSPRRHEGAVTRRHPVPNGRRRAVCTDRQRAVYPSHRRRPRNLVAFGTVNANRRHYQRAAKVLARADRSWLEQLVTRHVSPQQVDEALARDPDDIKVVMEFTHS